MPDLFDGDPAPNSSISPEDGALEQGSSILGQVRLRAVEAAKSFLIDMWLARHTEEKVMPSLLKVVDGCKETYADAVTASGGIYAAGYCIGGRYVLLLGSERQTRAGKIAPFIKAGALAHGASVTPDDFKGLKVPVSLVCVENDPLFPDEVRTAGEDAMSNANLEHEVQVYPGVPHGESHNPCSLKGGRLTCAGFAVVGEYQDTSIKEAQAQSYDQMLNWLKSH